MSKDPIPGSLCTKPRGQRLRFRRLSAESFLYFFICTYNCLHVSVLYSMSWCRNSSVKTIHMPLLWKIYTSETFRRLFLSPTILCQLTRNVPNASGDISRIKEDRLVAVEPFGDIIVSDMRMRESRISLNQPRLLTIISFHVPD